MDSINSIPIKLKIDDKQFHNGLHKIEESLKKLGKIRLTLDDKQFSKEVHTLGKFFGQLNHSIDKIETNIKGVSKAFTPINKSMDTMKQSSTAVGKQFDTMITKMNKAKAGFDKMKDNIDKNVKNTDKSKDKADDKSGNDKKFSLEKIVKNFELIEKFGKILLDLATKTKTFDILLQMINPVLTALTKVIDQLLQPLLPLVQVIADTLLPVISFLGTLLGTALTPVIKGLFIVIQWIGMGLILLAKGIGIVWNAIISFVSGIFRSLANFEILGMKPFKSLENVSKSMDKMKLNLSVLDKMPKSLTSSYSEVNSYVQKTYKPKKPSETDETETPDNTVSSVFAGLEGVFNQIAVKQNVYNMSEVEVLQAKYEALMQAVEEATGAQDANTEAGLKLIKDKYAEAQSCLKAIEEINAMANSTNEASEEISKAFTFKDFLNGLDQVAQNVGEAMLEQAPMLKQIADIAKEAFSGIQEGFRKGGVKGALQGGLEGALQGGIIGFLSELIIKSKTFAQIMAIINPLLQAMADMVGMILEPLLPLIQLISTVLTPVFQVIGTILGSVLAPILQALFPVFKLLGLIVTGVAIVFAKAWNAVASAINWALGWLGVHVNLINEGGLQEAWDQLINMTWEGAMAQAQNAQATNEATEALRNVPEGFKIALARFSAAQGIPAFAGGGFVPYTPGGRIVRVAENPPGEWIMNSSQIGGAGITVNFNAPVYGVDDFKRVVLNTVYEAKRSTGMASYGVAGF
jgi:phage-related protein